MPMPNNRSRRMKERRARERMRIATIVAGTSFLLLAAGAILWLLGAPSRGGAAIGGPFQLSASNGRVIDNRSFPGRFTLLYFGYTHCQDICPTTLAALARALRLLGQDAARVQPLFITVDPARDTPAVLQAYLTKFTPRLIGLTGTPEQIAAVEHAYHVVAIVRRTGFGYSVDHSAVLYLMSPDGRFLAPIRVGETAAAMAATIAQYIS